MKYKKTELISYLLVLFIIPIVLIYCASYQNDIENKNDETSTITVPKEVPEETPKETPKETIVETFKLNVPFVRMEEYSFDCEISAITMMLKYAGANVTLIQMKKEMPYHESDPNQGFVMGNKINVIYPSALMGLVNKYTNGGAVNLTGTSYDELKKHLKAGFPIVVWVGDFYSPGLYGYNNEYFESHTICLTGYDNYGLYYNDPYTGAEHYIYKDDFEFHWERRLKRAISYT